MKNIMIVMFIIILVVGGYFVFGKSGNDNVPITGNAILNGEVQKLVLSEEGLNYYPQQVKVKVNQPVSLSLDEKVKGCLRTITIRDLGVSKYLKTSQDSIEFLPTKKGVFTIACSMGMGLGKLIVE